MPLTIEQRETRRHAIGSSDAAAIMGVDPFKTAGDVWLVKTGRADDFEGNEHTRRGDLLEPALVTFAEQELGVKLKRGVQVVCKKHPELAANLDALHVDAFAPVEAKSSSNESEWGEPGSDQVPDRVIVQTHHQMFCIGPTARVAYVPVIVPEYKRFDFRMYRVERDDKLAEMIAERCLDFRMRYIVAGLVPDNFKPSIDVLKRVRRIPDTVAKVADTIVETYIAASEAFKAADKARDNAKAQLIAALDTAEAGQWSGGKFTYLTTKRKGYQVEACEFRQLRLMPNK